MKRVVNAASAEAEKFADLHDSGDFNGKSHIYDQIYSILDKYGTDNDLVHDLYDRASLEDQKRLMELAKQANQTQSDVPSKSELKEKFYKLQMKSERDATSAYEDGYFDAMCDIIDAFGIKL